MRAAALLFLLALSLGCSVHPETSDTGYVGTWARGEGFSRRSVSIVRAGEGYLFRPRHRSPDGAWILDCGWDGRCIEKVDGEQTSTYTFRTWIDPDSSHLMVECTGTVTKPQAMDIHYVDELVVEPGGKTIRVYEHERAGQRYEGDARPQFVFTKIADTVAEPPGAAR